MDKKYRCTFFSTKEDKWLDLDVTAPSMEEASRKGLRYSCDNYLHHKGFTDMTVSEIPEGDAEIGIEFRYRDTVFKQDFQGHVFVVAGSEKEAKEKYMETYFGKRFWFDAGKIDPTGKCVYGEVLRTYYV